MIYTITCNPAVDYVVQLEHFSPGTINRSKRDLKEAGGKGINVSRVLEIFGEKSIALGFVGGFTGKFIEDALHEAKIAHDFVSLKEDTRINVKLKAATEETEINGTSPTIEENDYAQLVEKLSKLKADDVVVLAGSLPNSLPKETYRSLVSLLNEKGIKAILDTSGAPLKEAIQASPAFIKPNHIELAELFEEDVQDDEDIVRLAKRLNKEYNIDHVLISMAKDGAIYVGQEQVFRLRAPKGTAVNSVGAGDSAVAGFLYKWQETKDAKKAAQFAVAAGSATAFSPVLCTKEEVDTLLPRVEVETI